MTLIKKQQNWTEREFSRSHRYVFPTQDMIRTTRSKETKGLPHAAPSPSPLPLIHRPSKFRYPSRARICKRLSRAGIYSEESIKTAYVVWRAGTTNRVVVLARQAENRFLGSLKGLQIRALDAGALHKTTIVFYWKHQFQIGGQSVHHQLPCPRNTLKYLGNFIGFLLYCWNILKFPNA